MKCEIDEYGDKIWYNDAGQIHREDGPAIEASNGSKYWYVNGKFHREDGPAWASRSGSKTWYINGKLHKLDGPAIDWTNDHKEWWIDGEQIYCKDNEEFLRIVKIKELL
jgi:hypothetical protein